VKRRRRRKRGGPAVASRRCCWRFLTGERLGRWPAFLLLLRVFFPALCFSVSVFFCASSSRRFCLLLILSSCVSNGGCCCGRSDGGPRRRCCSLFSSSPCRGASLCFSVFFFLSLFCLFFYFWTLMVLSRVTGRNSGGDGGSSLRWQAVSAAVFPPVQRCRLLLLQGCCSREGRWWEAAGGC